MPYADAHQHQQQDNDINNLNIIHIAGTKGKGSTCAFTQSLLRAHGLRTGFPKRIGVYTSPHVQCIRERIQLDNKPISEDLFTQYFFEVWDKLVESPDSDSGQAARQPRFLQLLALLGFHTFISEGVGAAVIETHHGGEYDVTNVIRKPVVTGATSLGMDHADELDPTIENIAWHKAGIFKAGAPAFSVPQDETVESVLGSRADEKGSCLSFISTADVSSYLPADSEILSIPVQRLNCSLTLGLVNMFLQITEPDHTLTPDDIASGVENHSLNGRFEVIQDKTSTCQWFLDGAHNPSSLKVAAQWFSKFSSNDGQRRILIFAHVSTRHGGPALVECLGHALLKFGAMPRHAIFTTYPAASKIAEVPEGFSSFWEGFDPEASVSIESSVEEAIRRARQISGQEGGMNILVTGSLFLVGGALDVLRP